MTNDVPDADREAVCDALLRCRYGDNLPTNANLLSREQEVMDDFADAAIAALRAQGWRAVPEGWTLVPSVPDGWLPMSHTWQDCMDFDAHMLNRLSASETTHRALLFQRVAGKLEELAMLRASKAAAPEPPQPEGRAGG